MQRRTVQHLGAIGFAVLPWIIWYLWDLRWIGHGAHFQPSMDEHLFALLTLSFGATCSILAMALALVKPRKFDTTVLGVVVFSVGVWYFIDVVPIIVAGFHARWSGV